MYKLNIEPKFGTIEQSRKIGYSVSGIENKFGCRISFENATHNAKLRENGSVYSYVPAGVSEAHGHIDIEIPEFSYHSAVSFFVTVEAMDKNGKYERSSILSATYNISDLAPSGFDGKISVDESFVGKGDVVKVSVEYKPKSKIILWINNSNFSVVTNDGGFGSISVRANDLLSDDIKVVQQLPILVLTESDHYSKLINSGTYLNLMPDAISTFASCDPSDPKSVCIEVSKEDSNGVSYTLPEPTDNFLPSPLSTGTDCKPFSVLASDQLCSVYSHDAVLLNNGMSLVSGTGLYSKTDQEKIGRAFVISDKTSVDRRSFFKRFGTIPADKAYFEEELFIFVDETTYSIASVGWVISIDHEMFSNRMFSISQKIHPSDSSAPAGLPSQGFVLSPADEISTREPLDQWISCVPYTLSEPLGCSPVVVFPSKLEKLNGSTGVLLPMVTNVVGQNVSAIRASISASNQSTTLDSGVPFESTYVYVVAEAISGGISQLFLYSFLINAGSTCSSQSISESTYGWKQITFSGENRNPKTKCDKSGNLHIFWESDRGRPNQIYYGVLGPSAASLSNSALTSAFDKQAQLFSSTDKPSQYLSESIGSIHKATSLDFDVVGDEYSANTAWVPSTTNNGTVEITDNQTIRISGNPLLDQSLAFTVVDKDVAGPFTEGFKQRAVGVSFRISNTNSQSVLSDAEIDSIWKSFKSAYSPLDSDSSGVNTFSFEGNKFILGKSDRYFDRVIPICGSYKNDSIRELLDSDLEISDSEFVATAYGDDANIRNFMLALMPEKVRLKATNTQTLEEYADGIGRNVYSALSSYVTDQESLIYTGRYKLMVLINADTEYVGNTSKKKYILSRQISEPFSLNDDGVSIEISQNYRRMYMEEVVSWFGNKSENSDSGSLGGDVDEIRRRCLCSLVIGINEEIKYAESFIADLSDEYRRFDIGIGFPGSGRFITNDFKPYETMVFDNIGVDFSITELAVGVPNIYVNGSVCNISDDHYALASMNVPDSFTDTELPLFIKTENQASVISSWLKLGFDISGLNKIPITLEGTNRSVSVSSGFGCSDFHICWESNRDSYWNIFYSHATDRAVPFRFDTRITKSKSQSLMPSIGVDANGNRLIAWHDNRDGKFSIYAAKGFADLVPNSPICAASRDSEGSNCFVLDTLIEFSVCNKPCDLDNLVLLLGKWCDPLLFFGGDAGVVLREQAAGGSGNFVNYSILVAYQFASHNGSTYNDLLEVNKFAIKSFYNGGLPGRLDASDGPFFANGPGSGQFLDFKPYWFEEIGVGGYEVTQTYWYPTEEEAQTIYDTLVGFAGDSMPTANSYHNIVLHLSFTRNEDQSDEDSKVTLIKAYVCDCTTSSSSSSRSSSSVSSSSISSSRSSYSSESSISSSRSSRSSESSDSSGSSESSISSSRSSNSSESSLSSTGSVSPVNCCEMFRITLTIDTGSSIHESVDPCSQSGPGYDSGAFISGSGSEYPRISGGGLYWDPLDLVWKLQSESSNFNWAANYEGPTDECYQDGTYTKVSDVYGSGQPAVIVVTHTP